MIGTRVSLWALILFEIPLQKFSEKEEHRGTKEPLCKKVHIKTHLIHIKEIISLGKRSFPSPQVNKVTAEINPRADCEDYQCDNGIDPLKIELHVGSSFSGILLYHGVNGRHKKII
jgi:hypothetical protein